MFFNPMFSHPAKGYFDMQALTTNHLFKLEELVGFEIVEEKTGQKQITYDELNDIAKRENRILEIYHTLVNVTLKLTVPNYIKHTEKNCVIIIEPKVKISYNGMIKMTLLDYGEIRQVYKI